MTKERINNLKEHANQKAAELLRQARRSRNVEVSWRYFDVKCDEKMTYWANGSKLGFNAQKELADMIFDYIRD